MSLINIEEKNRYSQFVHSLADKLGVDSSEASDLINAINNKNNKQCPELDNIELMIALNLSVKNSHSLQDPRIQKLKFLLKNNNKKAINITRLWVDKKLSFETMLAAF